MSEESTMKALIVLGWSSFQSGKGMKRGAPKSDYIQEHLEEKFGVEAHVTLHLESSWKPLVSRHGLHFLDSICRVPKLVLCMWSAALNNRASSGQKFDSKLRGIWSQARIEFWTKHIISNEYVFVAGQILTNEEIAAAELVGIPSVELPHGVFDEETALWYLSAKPSIFAIWPNQDAFALKKRGLVPVAIPLPPIVEQKRSPFGSRQLLVCLTWGVIDSVDGLGGIPRGLWSQLHALESQFPDIRFRLHPVFPPAKRRRLERFLRREYPKAQVSPRSRSLEEDLSDCKVVMLDRSSVWVEAIQRGIPVLTTSLETFIRAKKFEQTLVIGGTRIAFLPNDLDSLDKILSNDAKGEVCHSWSEFDSLLQATVFGSQVD